MLPLVIFLGGFFMYSALIFGAFYYEELRSATRWLVRAFHTSHIAHIIPLFAGIYMGNDPALFVGIMVAAISLGRVYVPEVMA